MLTTGAMDADIILLPDQDENQTYIKSGLFVALDEHFADMPNFTKWLDANPVIKAEILPISLPDISHSEIPDTSCNSPNLQPHKLHYRLQLLCRTCGTRKYVRCYFFFSECQSRMQVP